MKLNFECTKCKKIFDSEVGKIAMNEQTLDP